MPLTITRPTAFALPALDALLLRREDLPGFRLVFCDAEHAGNEALSERSPDPEHSLRRYELWGRVDGIAARFVPEVGAERPETPIVVDSSAARFRRGTGALQALTDDAGFTSGATRLFPRNIADNTECVHEVFEEDGAQFDLYRVDFREANVLGSVGVVWRRPRGNPLAALKLAERQAERIRTALRKIGAAPSGLLRRE